MHDQLADLLKTAGFSDSEGHVAGVSAGRSGSSSGEDSATTRAIEEATAAVTQLAAATQGNADSITANANANTNTQNAQSSSGGGVASTVGDMASGLLGGGSSFGSGLLGGGLSLLLDGIESLFGGGSNTPPPLTTYVPPDAQNFELATSNGSLGDAVYDSAGQPRETDVAQTAISNVQPAGANVSSGTADSGGAGKSSASNGQQITVQVQAMDSQSFLDRSGDIASAVRQAMLNMHSINDVVGDL